MKYLVSVTRVSYYEIETETEEEAVDRVLDGEVEESHGETTTVLATSAKS